jgi:hypothetical protein
LLHEAVEAAGGVALEDAADFGFGFAVGLAAIDVGDGVGVVAPA